MEIFSKYILESLYKSTHKKGIFNDGMISERDLFCVHGPQTDRETDSRAGGESAGGLQCCLSCDSQTLGGGGGGRMEPDSDS